MHVQYMQRYIQGTGYECTGFSLFTALCSLYMHRDAGFWGVSQYKHRLSAGAFNWLSSETFSI